jgi:hypothetical protein
MAQFIGSLVFSLAFFYYGFRYICRELPEVRAHIRDGSGTSQDLARLKKNRIAGWCFVGVGVCMDVLALLHFFRWFLKCFSERPTNRYTQQRCTQVRDANLQFDMPSCEKPAMDQGVEILRRPGALPAFA